MGALSKTIKEQEARKRLRELTADAKSVGSSASAPLFDISNLLKDQPDLIPISVVCDDLKLVKRKTVHDWRHRPENYPAGRAQLTILTASGLMFVKPRLIEWLNSINRKGVKKK